MQFNARNNVLYFRSGSEDGLSNKSWCEVFHTGNRASYVNRLDTVYWTGCNGWNVNQVITASAHCGTEWYSNGFTFGLGAH